MTTTTAHTTSIATVTLEVTDVDAARRFYTAFGGVEAYIELREASENTGGFRGFTLALTVSQPATVDAFLDAAVEAGAEVIKPATKSLWGLRGGRRPGARRDDLEGRDVGEEEQRPGDA